MDTIGIAMIGCGTVGGGVAKLLVEEKNRLTARCGKVLQLRHIVVRDPAKARLHVPGVVVSTSAVQALADPQVSVVVELVGGVNAAKDYVLAALRAGKHVVTANKHLLAEHGAEIFEAAQKRARRRLRSQCRRRHPDYRRHSSIVGRQSNHRHSRNLERNQQLHFDLYGGERPELCRRACRAQRLGYAEADPTLDVDGSDAVHKLAILAQIAFGVAAPFAGIERYGIADLHPMDLRFAQELGYTIKLLAEAWLDEREVALHVAPVLLRHKDMLAQVRGAYNAIQVTGDVVGEMLFQGAGAGALPTASAVVADLMDIAIGRGQRTFAAAQLWSAKDRGYRLKQSEGVRSRFYLRVLVQDEPGLLADVARALAVHQISIASVIQHEALEGHVGQVVPLVIMTHYAPTGGFRDAIKTINALRGVAGEAVYYSVDD